MLRRTIGEHIELATSLERGLGAVRADVGQIEQVVMNLAVNARDAMPEGGTLEIETANVAYDQASAKREVGIESGDYVLLRVSDTGHGIDAELLESIFEPFFTTKPEGKGTGLGLSMVYGIVTQNDGVIRVSSEVGTGTTFKVYLPRVVGAPERPSYIAPKLEKPTGKETVLLVEDDDLVRQAFTRMLGRAGYKVLTARSGGDAIVTAEKAEGAVDLLVTDMIMPHMSGRELAERLSGTYENLPVLFISGYLGDDILDHGTFDLETSFLEKPFTEQQFLEKIRGLLDRRPAG